jgi:hypothetical protein
MLGFVETPLEGRCACGAVIMQLAPPTLFASYCHCASCRRAHAAPFVAWTAVPNERFRLVQGRDAVASYASSPGVSRAFCGRCGTPVWYRGEAAPDRIYVPVAVLDRLDRPLDSHVSYEERPAWAAGLQRLPCYREKGDEPLAWE